MWWATAWFTLDWSKSTSFNNITFDRSMKRNMLILYKKTLCQISSCKKFSFSCIKEKILGLKVKLKTLEIFFNCSEMPMFCKWWNVCGKNLREQQKITFVSIQVNSLTHIHTVSKNVSVSLFTYANGIQNIVIISGIAPLLHVYVCVYMRL